MIMGAISSMGVRKRKDFGMNYGAGRARATPPASFSQIQPVGEAGTPRSNTAMKILDTPGLLDDGWINGGTDQIPTRTFCSCLWLTTCCTGWVSIYMFGTPYSISQFIVYHLYGNTILDVRLLEYVMLVGETIVSQFFCFEFKFTVNEKSPDISYMMPDSNWQLHFQVLRFEFLS